MNEVAPMVIADPLAAFEKRGMVKLIAPAKVNLYLDIRGKRNDGYHEVTTIMHALGLHDVIHIDHEYDGDGIEGVDGIQADPGDGRERNGEGGLRIRISCHARGGIDELAIEPEQNIVHRAIDRLARKIGRAEDETISVRIEKHIPSEAGLGGGSSDAAAALLGVAHLWKLDPHSPELLEVASELGADVPFFLRGGCSCCTGVGETFDHALTPLNKSLVVIKPVEGVSTREAYAAFDEHPRMIDGSLRERALTAQRAEDVPLCNNLTEASASLVPELAKIDEWLAGQVGVEESLMTGSGSATFAICSTFDDACRVVASARARGWWARATIFTAAGASIVPR